MIENVNVGIDLGGSHVSIGIVSDDGKIIENYEKDFTVIEKHDLINVAIKFIAQNIRGLKQRYSFSKLGIGIPGTISDGVIIKSVNLGVKNYDIKKALEDKINIKVNVKNDAKCAAIGEYNFGICKNFKNILFLTLGTGIGGAYIYQGKLLEGTKFEGAEFGHIIIKDNGLKCRCGKSGCFEKYGSILAFKNNVIKRLNLSYDISGKELRTIIENSKSEVEDIQTEYIKDLAIGISNLINIFEPDCTIIGGGFTRYSYLFLNQLKEKIIKSDLLFNKRKDLIIQPAELGNDAGIVGASTL